jgi:hypothetical protein
METLVKVKHDVPIMVLGLRLEITKAIRASNYFSLACREWNASFLSLTPRSEAGRGIRIDTNLSTRLLHLDVRHNY